MDLELSDEQGWLSESVETLLTREWVGARTRRSPPATDERARLWAALTEFGALEELGAVELCLISRALGAHLASVPFLGSAALRYAGAEVDGPVALGLLEPGGDWSLESPATELVDGRVSGEKVEVEHAGAGRVAVLAGVGRRARARAGRRRGT